MKLIKPFKKMIRYDEFGHYYNQDGVPVEKNEEFEDVEEEEVKYVPAKQKKQEDYEEYEDEFVKEYMLGFKENEEVKEELFLPEEICKKFNHFSLKFLNFSLKFIKFFLKIF